MKAYYFAPPDERLAYKDSRKITVGKMHTVRGTPKLCHYGLHGSVNVLDALGYAKSNILYRVEITRNVAVGDDKIAGQRRVYLARLEATEVLRPFARQAALLHIEKIKPYTDKYDLIVEYLATGQGKLRQAAHTAANAAANAAATATAYTDNAAAYAANAAAHAAANAAAYAAAHTAANAAVYDAAYATAHAATYAATYATREKLNKMLEELVTAAFKEQGYTEV